LMWCAIAFSQKPRFFLGGNRYFTISIVFFVFVSLITFLLDNKLILNRYTAFIMIPLFYWIYNYNSIYRGLKSNIRILIISLVFVLYTSLQTTTVLILNPYASRSMKTSVEGN